MSIMKVNKLFFNEHVVSKIHKYMEDKINIQNVLKFYQLAKHFGLSHVAEVFLNHIERCFTMLIETQNFMELDYPSISRILADSGLLITSELEVYNAGDKWLSYNIEERSKFAKNILLKVRLHLLSDHALKYLLSKSSSFTGIKQCVSVIKSKIASSTKCFEGKLGVQYTNRCCNQNSFNILVCGGHSYHHSKLLKNVNMINGNNFKDIKVLPSMINERRFAEAICLKGDVYIFGDCYEGNTLSLSVEKYSPSTNIWNKVADMFDYRDGFCSCGFMDSIFIIGGDNGTLSMSTCLQFVTKDYKWKQVNKMNEARIFAACALFEEKIIVSGGRDNNCIMLKTVEMYDIDGDNWSPMANMTKSKSRHSLVVVNSKLYVIGSGSNNCEVFDNSCKQFVAIKSRQTNYLCLNKAISIGSKILAFQNNRPSIVCYDVDNEEWSEESCAVTDDLRYFSCITLPWYI